MAQTPPPNHLQPMLLGDYKDDAVRLACQRDGGVFVSEKYDGHRMVFGGRCCYSRGGIDITTSVPAVIKDACERLCAQVSKDVPGHAQATTTTIYLDGELWGGHGTQASDVTSLLGAAAHDHVYQFASQVQDL